MHYKVLKNFIIKLNNDLLGNFALKLKLDYKRIKHIKKFNKPFLILLNILGFKAFICSEELKTVY